MDANDPFTSISVEKWNRILAINLTGAFNWIQAAVPTWSPRGWGRIVTISSSSAQSGRSDRAHYVASKGGLIALTKALSFEFAPKGITANTIPPSIIDTPMVKQATEAGTFPGLELIATMTPVRRAGSPRMSQPLACSSAATKPASSPASRSARNGGWYL